MSSNKTRGTCNYGFDLPNPKPAKHNEKSFPMTDTTLPISTPIRAIQEHAISQAQLRVKMELNH